MTTISPGYNGTPTPTSKPRLKKTINGALTDANLEFYNLSNNELVETTSSDDFTINNNQITINTNNPLFMWVPPIVSKNEGESYTRTTYQLQFKPKLRTFNSEKTTASKWYFNDNILPGYIISKQSQNFGLYDESLNYKIGLVQPNSSELLDYNLESYQIFSEIVSNNNIDGTINTSTLPVALTDFTLVKITDNNISNSNTMVYLIGGKDSSGTAVDTVYKSILSGDGVIDKWELSSLVLPVPLYNASCLYSANEEYLAVIGGNTGTGTYSSDIYIATTDYYNETKNFSSFQTYSGILPVGLENAAVATINISNNQYLIVAGGNNTEPISTIYAILTNDGEFTQYSTAASILFTLSQTLPFSGTSLGYSIAYYTEYGGTDTFFLIGDDGTNSYIVTFNNNLPSNDSTDSTTPLTLSLNTYKLPYLGPTNRNSLPVLLDNNLLYIGSNAGINSLYYFPLETIMSETAITDVTDITTISNIPLTQPESIINNGWVFGLNGLNIFSIGGEIDSTPTTDIVVFPLINNLDFYYEPYPLDINSPLTFIPSVYYFIDPIKVYNLISSNTPTLTPTEVYNKTLTQNDKSYSFGNTILNTQNGSEYTEVITYDPKLELFTLKLTIYGSSVYENTGFSFRNSFFPFFFIPYFVFNNIDPISTNLTSSALPNTIYTLFENILTDTVITGLSLLVEGSYNNSDVNLTNSNANYVPPH